MKQPIVIEIWDKLDLFSYNLNVYLHIINYNNVFLVGHKVKLYSDHQFSTIQMSPLWH